MIHLGHIAMISDTQCACNTSHGNNLSTPNSGSSFSSDVDDCDGFDNNCNGEIDEDLSQDFFLDADGLDRAVGGDFDCAQRQIPVAPIGGGAEAELFGFSGEGAKRAKQDGKYLEGHGFLLENGCLKIL